MSPQYSKQELCDAVYTAVCRAGRPLSRLEICQAIGRKKSPHIIAMIESLTADGWLVKSASVTNKKAPVFVYSLGRLASNSEVCND